MSDFAKGNETDPAFSYPATEEASEFVPFASASAANLGPGEPVEGYAEALIKIKTDRRKREIRSQRFQEVKTLVLGENNSTRITRGIGVVAIGVATIDLLHPF